MRLPFGKMPFCFSLPLLSSVWILQMMAGALSGTLAHAATLKKEATPSGGTEVQEPKSLMTWNYYANPSSTSSGLPL